MLLLPLDSLQSINNYNNKVNVKVSKLQNGNPIYKIVGMHEIKQTNNELNQLKRNYSIREWKIQYQNIYNYAVKHPKAKKYQNIQIIR